MSAWLIVFVTVCYAGVALGEVIKGNTAVAIMFFGYCIANVGTIMLVIK